jgi:hypothetical protein
LQGIEISNTEKSLSFSWDPVANAVEYLAYEELPKPEYDRDPLAPIYRGEIPEFTHDGLGPREVSRIRIVAIDEREEVLARTLVRTSTGGSAEAAQEINWIASSEGLEIFLGSQEEKVPLLENYHNREFSSENLEETFFDSEFSGEPEVYQLLSEEQFEPVPLRNPDAPLPEKVPQNHVVEVPDFRPPESGDLSGELESIERAQITQIMSRQFEWEAFIADDYIPAPEFCDTAWDDIGHMHFGGDNRDFSRWTNGNTNRFRMSVRADFSLPNFTSLLPPAFAGWNDPSMFTSADVGTTTLYAEQEDGSMEQTNSATAPLDELYFNTSFINRTTAEFYMLADSTNPLCEVLGIFDAPAINAAMTVILHTDGSYSYAGFRDGAPNHSAILATHWIQTFPNPSVGQFINSMRNPHITCVHKHTNVGFTSLALPAHPITFNSSEHSDPSATGDCSTVNP